MQPSFPLKLTQPERRPFRQHLGVAGFFRMDAVDSVTGKTRELVDWFPNLITDAGLDRHMVGSAFGTCMVGTGSNPPLNGDTTLQSQLASTTTTVAGGGTTLNTSVSPWYLQVQTVFQFNVGVAAGNLTEVGVGWSSTLVYSRSLIKDGTGTPTTITVLPTEYLNVTYRWRLYPPMNDQLYDVNITGSGTHSVTHRTSGFSTAWCRIDSGAFQLPNPGVGIGSVYGTGATLGSMTGSPSASSNTTYTGCTSAWLAAYTPGSFKRAWRLTCPPSSVNVTGGIHALYISYSGYPGMQYLLATPIAKDANKRLTLDFELSWGRYTPP